MAKLGTRPQQKQQNKELEDLSRRAAKAVLNLAGILHHTTGAQQLTRKTPFRQLQALLVLSEYGPVTIGELGRIMNLAPSTGSELANRIVNAGLASRKPGNGDRRQCLLVLTDQGKQEARQYHSAVRKAMQSKLSALTNKQREELLESLEKIVSLLGSPGSQ